MLPTKLAELAAPACFTDEDYEAIAVGHLHL
jgi:hypothetical protein